MRRARHVGLTSWRRAFVAIALLLLLVVGPGAFLYLRNPNRVQGAWFDSNWGFRQKIPITNSSGSTQTDFQVQVTIDTSTLITAGKLQSSCQDIRFTNINGKALSYWVEPNTCNTTTTKAWVKVDSIPTSGTDIYYYYGNAQASANSYSDRTFIREVNSAAAAWPLDDTTTTQSLSRVVNATASAGRNIVINGTFDADTNWTKGTGWTIADGVAHATGVSTANLQQSTIPLTVGKTYEITYTISNYVSGQVRANAGGSDGTGTQRTANGTYTQRHIASGGSGLFLQVTTTFTGDIDNVIVTQVNIPASDATPVQLLTDGNMETSGVAAWTALHSATLSKQTTSPHGGSQVLRTAYNGVAAPGASQLILTVGQVYRVYGYARSDGTSLPVVANAGTTLFTGTASTAWQPFDVTFVAVNSSLDIRIGSGSTGYGEFDDVVVSLDTGIRSGELIDDGNMETSGTGVWVAQNSAVITKDTSSPHGGTQNLRVARNGVTNTPQAFQSILNIGKTYRAVGYAKSDGSAIPRIFGGAATLFTGTTSTSWQSFDITFVAGATNFTLQSQTSTGTQYTEWDDISVTEVSPLVGLPTNGVTLGSSSGSGGHLTNAYTFDGTNDVVNIYSSDLNSVFNGDEGTVILWAKVSGSGVWSDGSSRYLFNAADSLQTNILTLFKVNTPNNTVRASFLGKSVDITTSTTNWFQVGISWSRPGNQVKVYFNGAQSGSTQTGVSTWSSNLGSSRTVIGAQTNAGTGLPWSGMINDVRVYSRVLSPEEIAAQYSASTDIQAYTTSNYLGKELFRKYNTSVTVGAAATEETGQAPVAYWKLDDGTGQTPQDSAQNRLSMTLGASSSSASDDPTWQTEDMCISGKCLKFDGTNDYATVADTSVLEPSTAVTLSTWIKRTGANGTRQIFIGKGNLGSAVTTSYWVELNTSNQLRFEIGRNSTQSTLVATDKTITDNNWHLVEATWDGTTMKIYLDGLQSTVTTAASGTLNNTTQNFSIGQGGVLNSLYFNGFMDEPKVFNYARSAAQIKADYQFGVSSMQGRQSQGPLSNGLIGYWKMDEAAANTCTGGVNDACDSSGFGNDGAWTGNATTAAGKFGNGTTYGGGASDYINIPDNSLFEGNAQMTVSIWVYDNAYSGAQHDFFSKGGEPSGVDSTWAFYRSTTGVTSRVSNGTTNVNLTSISGGGWRDDQWNLVTTTYDGATARLFINGILQDTDFITGLTDTNTNAIRIGAHVNANDGFDGKLDEARVYNRALSPDEVSQLYSFAPGPVGYWKMDEGTGTSSFDSSGNGYTGTLVNSPAWVAGKYGKGLFFNNISTYVTPNTFAADLSKQFTVAAWVNIQAIGNDYFVYINGIRLERRTVNFFGCNTPGQGAHLSSGVAPSTNTWYYLTCTYDGTTRKMYVDGILKASDTFTIGALDTTRIIGWSDSSAAPQGTIDDVKVYNYARSAAQIQEDMRSATLAVSSVGGTSSTQPASAFGYWKFDEGQGTVANNAGSGGSAFNGTLTNMASPATTTSGWNNSGKVNKALSFDGSDDYVSIPDNDALDFGSSDFTISTWVKIEASNFSASQGILGKGSASNNFAYVLLYDNNGSSTTTTIGFRANNNGILLTSSANAGRVNQWQHIVVTRIGSTFTMYVDGKQVATTTSATAITANSDVLGIEKAITGLISPARATIDEIKIFHGGLTPDQVRTEYNAGLSTNYGVGASSEASTLVSGAGNAPVGEWTFEERTGTSVKDTSGNGNTGTWNGTTTNVWTTGKYGSAGNFNGTNNYVNIPYNSNLELANSGSISVWFKPNTLAAGTHNIVSYGGTSYATGYLINQFGSGLSAYWLSGSPSIDLSLSTIFTTSNWYHIEFVNNNGSLSLYVNGVLKGTGTSGGTITADLPTIIGGTPTLWYTNSSIDDVKIYNYARSAAQVAYDYNRGAPIGWWKMDECQGGTLNDSSGNGNTGTLSVGASGTQTAIGTCNTASSAWGNGTTGKYNSSVKFDGTDDYVQVTDTNNLYQLTGDMTLSAWVKTTSTSTRVLISKGTTTDWMYALYLSDGRPVMQLYQANSGSNYAQALGPASATFNDGNWHLITGTFTGSTTKVYADGKLLATSSSTSGTRDTSTAGALYFSNFINSGNSFLINGQMDDVRIFNYALSDTAVKKLYNNGLSVFYGPSTGAP